jgi:hypothetical protein
MTKLGEKYLEKQIKKYSETCLCWPPMVPPKTAQLIENHIFYMTTYKHSNNNYTNRNYSAHIYRSRVIHYVLCWDGM